MKKATGNMYSWVTHTHSPIVGCPHQCSYCYIRYWGQLEKTPRLIERRLHEDLGQGNIIFIGHWCDMWAEDVPYDWIILVLDQCFRFDNTYVFQSKNPSRFLEFIQHLPRKVMFGTTIETNRWDILKQHTQAPSVSERAWALGDIRTAHRKDFSIFKIFITIEPIFDFDVEELVDLIHSVSPDFVVIGADSKGHKLPEPSAEKVNQLIHELSKITEVKIKANLRRLTDE